MMLHCSATVNVEGMYITCVVGVFGLSAMQYNNSMSRALSRVYLAIEWEFLIGSV